jgi:hypothetical protein
MEKRRAAQRQGCHKRPAEQSHEISPLCKWSDYPPSQELSRSVGGDIDIFKPARTVAHNGGKTAGTNLNNQRLWLFRKNTFQSCPNLSGINMTEMVIFLMKTKMIPAILKKNLVV